MQVRLLYKEQDHKAAKAYSFPNDLMKDLNLDVVLHTMARQDEQVRGAVWREMTHPLTEPEEIRYRQEIISDIAGRRDCFVQLHDFLKKMAKVVQDFRELERSRRGGGRIGAASFLIEKLHCLSALTEGYQKLLPMMAEGDYQSEGMRGLYERLAGEFPKARLKEILECIKELQFWLEDGSIVISAGFTAGLKLGDLRVNRMANTEEVRDRSRRRLTLREQFGKVFLKSNVEMLQEETLIGQEKQIEEAAVSWMLTGFDDYFEDSLDFFAEFYYEACFYRGCSNLIRRFQEWNFPLCVPEAVQKEEHVTAFRGLYDLSLAIYTQRRPIPNDLDADADLFIISGANQGGKSTWLRSVGCAQLFFQCGMLVPAISWRSRIYEDIFTHFGRKEDKVMNSGRFDEELRRMDQIIECMTPDALLLMNESFASTTEPEGALILRNITDALYELGVTVFTVTHLFEYTQQMYALTQEEIAAGKHPGRMFLSAERLQDAHRTRRIYPAEPSPTSYGLDLFEEMVCEEGAACTQNLPGGALADKL